MPQFSRLQLAAALLEYDNDSDDPTKPYRSAQDSAIFTHLRLRTAPREAIMQKEEPQPRRSIDYLGVKLPISELPPKAQELPFEEPPRPPSRQSLDMLQHQQRPASRQSFEQIYRPNSRAGSLHSMHKHHQRAQSRQSMDMLRPGSRQSMNTLGTSMFRGGDDDYDDEDAVSVDIPEVDLSSWGLDNFISKDELETKSKAPSVHSRAGSESLHTPAFQSATVAAAPSSWNNVQGPGRRRGRAQRAMSMGNQLETAAAASDVSHDSEKGSSMRRKPTRSRSVGGALDAAAFVQIEPVKFEKERRSSFSAGVPFPVQQSPTADDFTNPFELPLPSSARTSRFDPKITAHARKMSTASMGTMGGLAQSLADASDFFGGGPPSAGTRDEYNQRVRTYSDATMGSRMRLTEFGDNMSVAPGAAFDREQRAEERGGRAPGPKRMSKMDLLRPKVLVMPSPLQDETTPPEKPVREGFELTTDGRPLPPGAQTRPGISTSASGLSAANPYTTNPRLSMSLSQLTFRNTLPVDGQMDAAYADIDMKRALEDGEQIPVEYADEELRELQRPVGKLYGRSLMDDLQARKAQMRGKQRVFRGDDRPSMMQRGQSHNTFIDPATLQQGPMIDELGGGADPNPSSRNKRNTQAPLIDFNKESNTIGVAQNRLPNTRSVFGVDTLWERELTKLEKIKAEEQAEQEEQRAVEEAKRLAAEKKAAKKRTKGKGKADVLAPDPDAKSRVSAEPPSLPAYQTIHVKPPKDSDSESDDNINMAARIPRRSDETVEEKGWYASSSEDENGQPKRRKQKAAPVPQRRQPGNDSDSDDIPLAAQTGKSPLLRPPPESDSDEDQPLSAVLDKKIAQSHFPGSPQRSRPNHRPQDDDSDDDRPLALHQPRAPPQQRTAGDDGSDEDEKPLGMRYSQMPFTQAQQQQQMQQEQMQQMMFQQQMLQVRAAQMRSSMMFGAAAPFSPFGMPPNPMMMGVPGPPAFNPQATHDAAQYGRVDKWRRDVSSGVD